MIMNFERYDTYEVLKANLCIQYLTILEYLRAEVDSKKLQIQKDGKGHTYYVVSFPHLTNECDDILTTGDGTLRRVKKLSDDGYITLIMGKWNDPRFGYTRTAIKFNKKFDTLLKK